MSEKFMSRFSDCEYTIRPHENPIHPEESRESSQCKFHRDEFVRIEHCKYVKMYSVFHGNYFDIYDGIYFHNYYDFKCVLPVKLFEWCLTWNKSPTAVWFIFEPSNLFALTFEQLIGLCLDYECEHGDVAELNEYWKEVAKYFGCDPDNTEDILVKSYN